VREAVSSKCKVAPSRLLQKQSTVKSFNALQQTQGQHRMLPLVSIAQLQQGGGCRLEVMVLRSMQCDSSPPPIRIVKWDAADDAASDSFPLIRIEDVTLPPMLTLFRILCAHSACRSCIHNGKEALKVLCAGAACCGSACASPRSHEPRSLCAGAAAEALHCRAIEVTPVARA
jgi:hypothetical protein